MACNLIMNEAGQVRTTQFNATTHYDIGEINCYTPASMATNVQMYLILKNKKGLYEIIELVRSGSQGTNILYRIPINQSLRVNDEEVEVRLLLLDNKSDTYKISSSIKMIISTNHYNLARQVYIAQQVGAQTQSLYAKVLAMTEENKKMYEKIQEGVKK